MPFQSAFVTGASSGLGQAIALELAARGTRVVLAARRLSALKRVASDIESAGGRADVCVLDVLDVNATQQAVLEWDQRVGGFDLALANAGVGGTEHATRLDWETVDRILQVNVRGALACLVPLIRPMIERGHGTLSAVTSLAGLRGLPGSAPYSASKAAVSTFLESVRADLNGTGVVVVDVQPGFVDTPLTRKNDFPQPFMLTARDAAQRTVTALERGQPIVQYPLPTALAMNIAHHLPDAVWNTLARVTRFKN